jgi:hypothetical protein
MYLVGTTAPKDSCTAALTLRRRPVGGSWLHGHRFFTRAPHRLRRAPGVCGVSGSPVTRRPRSLERFPSLPVRRCLRHACSRPYLRRLKQPQRTDSHWGLLYGSGLLNPTRRLHFGPPSVGPSVDVTFIPPTSPLPFDSASIRAGRSRQSRIAKLAKCVQTAFCGIRSFRPRKSQISSAE